MKAFLLIAALPLLVVTPALAQSMDHSMSGMSMPGMQMNKPAAKAKPAHKPKKHIKRKKTHHAAKPQEGGKPMADMPGMAMSGDHAGKGGMDMSKSAAPAAAASSAMPGMAMPATKPQSDMAGMPGMKSGDTGVTEHTQMPGMKSGDMAAMPGMETPEEKVGNEPPPTLPTDHAAEKFYDPAAMKTARDQLRMEHGGEAHSKVMLNLGEFQVRKGENGYRWEGEAWFGGDINRFVVKSEGDGGVKSGVNAGEIQGLFSHAIGPYFDLQAGVRQDFKPTPARTYATVGFEGVAPYWFETNGALFLSSHGELLGRAEGTYDFRLTQRWILQPRAEVNLSAQDIRETGIGSGVSNVELGLRLRYEIRREFAPYVGISFDDKLGRTADFARARGEDPHQTSIVFGIRTWF